jgi:hypothetical protein
MLGELAKEYTAEVRTNLTLTEALKYVLTYC